MKNIQALSNGLIVAFLTVGLQAYATNLTFTETIPNINYEVEGQTYTGLFTDANLKSGSTVFNNTLETITSATVDLTIGNDAGGLPISLKIDGITADLSPNSSPQTLAYVLTATQYNYIQAHDGTFNYYVTVDCVLESAELIVTTTSSQTQVPDGGSTVMLLGGAVSVLGFIKRKMA